MKKYTKKKPISQDAIYKQITDRILKALDEGTAPWHKTWIGVDRPTNAITGNGYRGINVLLLGFTEFSMPLFAGFSQWKTLKNSDGERGSVLKGSKGISVYKALPVAWIENEDGTTSSIDINADFNGEGKRKFKTILKYVGTVFNIEQTNLKITDLKQEMQDKINVKVNKTELERNEEAQTIINDYVSKSGVTFQNKVQSAWYRPDNDTVNVPQFDTFEKSAYYYRTTFHELAHSTGHKSRLDRLSKTAVFGSENYGREELIAEISSAMLCGTIGIYEKVIDVSAGYIAGWKKSISDDPKIIVSSASKAQIAVDLILDN